MQFQLHAFEPASRANGPGIRAVIWFQGCTLGCPGCFNPATHYPFGGAPADTEDTVCRILQGSPSVEGVTLSGGEPFQQPEALLDIAARLHLAGLSALVFSGYTLEKLQTLPLGQAILTHIDVLVAGPYRPGAHMGRGLLGSSNQRIHLLTDRYRHADFADIPRCEVILHRNGMVTITGIAPATLGVHTESSTKADNR